MNIIGLFPLTGNGGIASWTKNLLDTFPNEQYKIYSINISAADRNDETSYLARIISGFKTLKRIIHDINKVITEVQIDILHTSTSGHISSYRDIRVANLCRKHNIKTVLHCHYGCITENYYNKGIVGWLTRKAFSLYDQIWVLDRKSYEILRSNRNLDNKVYLVPNPINIKKSVDIKPKKYTRAAFIGNVLPTKGIYELVEASVKTNIRLDIVGPISSSVREKISCIAGTAIGETIFFHGRVTNLEAVKLMNAVDIVALPTYYQSEAFPISIIEAMSLSKLVISCPRAAILDMLTSLDGNPCGILVTPHSSESIVEAIYWCQKHNEAADELCRRAYEKAYTSYRQEIVYKMYRENYCKLLKG